MSVHLSVADATALPLRDHTVDLICTSPPYGLDKPYPGSSDPAQGWERFMRDWLAEAYRVTKPGGRLALNVPLNTTKPVKRPTYAQAVAAAVEVGWSYQWDVIWREGNVSRTLARGSVDSPSAPHVIARVEMVPVFCKGEWSRRRSGRIGPHNLQHDEWLAWTNGEWSFPGESRPWEKHPAAFPPELPRRLITLLSFVGDVVLDPFMGSATVPMVARKLGRVAIGMDVSADYLMSARRRLERAA